MPRWWVAVEQPAMPAAVASERQSLPDAAASRMVSKRASEPRNRRKRTPDQRNAEMVAALDHCHCVSLIDETGHFPS